MSQITMTVQQQLDALFPATGRAGSVRPAQESKAMNRSSTEFALAPPTNDHGED